MNVPHSPHHQPYISFQGLESSWLFISEFSAKPTVSKVLRCILNTATFGI